MNIKYRIIRKDPLNRQIIVRFFTDIVDELYLASFRDPITNEPINLDENGLPINCRTDVAIEFPIRVLTQAEETALIMRHCRADWFENEERVINAANNTDTELDAVVSAISSMPETVGVLNYKPESTLQEKKDLMWEKIKIERDRRIQDGGYKVGTKWFHSNTFSRTQQMALMMMGAKIPANIQWKTMDKSTVLMTQTLAAQIFMAAAMSDTAIFAIAESHRVAMELLEDPTTYDYMTGWPLIFGE